MDSRLSIAYFLIALVIAAGLIGGYVWRTRHRKAKRLRRGRTRD